MSNLGPCELSIKETYKEKDSKEIKEMGEYIKSLRSANVSRQELAGYIRQYAKEKGIEIKSKYLNLLDTTGKGALNIDRMRNPKWKADPTQAALSFFEETSSVIEGAGHNVERIMEVKQKQFFGSMMSNLKKTGLLKAWEKGTFDREIREYIRFNKLPEGELGKTVKLLGDLTKDAYKKMNTELNAAGLMVSYRQDYDGPIVHSKEEIFGNFSGWVTKITDALNYKEEFPILSSNDIAEFENLKRSGQITEESENAVIKIFKNSYDNITKSLQEDAPLDENKFVSLSERRARAKSFTQWKSGEAVDDYLKSFGKYKTIAEQFNFYSKSTSRDIGLTSVLGASYSKGYQIIENELRIALKEKGFEKYQIDKEVRQLNIAYRNITESRAVVPGMLGNFLIAQRQMAALAKLGKSGATSFFLDPQSMANQRRILYGEGMLKSIFASYGHYFNSIKDAATLAEVEEKFLFSQHQLTTTLEELKDMAHGKDWLSIASEMVSKGSGGYFSNKVSHIASAKMWLSFLADGWKGKKFTEQAMADLAKFNIKEKDLEILNNLNLKDYGMINVNKMNVHEFMDLSKQEFKSMEDAEFQMVAFKEKINAWLLERVKKSAPIPGNRERRILYGDTIAGTLEGEFRRYFGQFKATTMKQMTDMTVGSMRSLNPNLDQVGFDQYKNKTSAYHVGKLAASLTMTGLTYNFFLALTRGDKETIDKFAEGDPTLLLDGAAKGGLGFILNDMIKMNDNYLYNLGQLASPSIAALVKHPTNLGKAIRGKPEKAIVDEIRTNLPGANLIWLAPFEEGFDDFAKEKARINSRNYLK